MKPPKSPIQKGRKYVIVCFEKHGNRYFDATSEENFLKSALKILKERNEEGWWYIKLDPPNKPDDFMSKEDIAKMPDGELKKVATRIHNQYVSAYKWYEDENGDYDLIQEAIKNKDGLKAWECLMFRSDGEYERVSIEELE